MRPCTDSTQQASLITVAPKESLCPTKAPCLSKHSTTVSRPYCTAHCKAVRCATSTSSMRAPLMRRNWGKGGRKVGRERGWGAGKVQCFDGRVVKGEVGTKKRKGYIEQQKLYVCVSTLTSIALSWPQRAAHMRGVRCCMCR